MIKHLFKLILIATIGICQQGFGDVFLVINTNDSGSGSLRQAIIDANTNSNFATFNNIDFNISGGGPHVIVPLNDLPDITHWVIIDGYSQPGALPATDEAPANILIEIQGPNTSVAALNLAAGSDRSIIRGLAINSCTFSAAIQLLSNFNIIAGNVIGTNAEGDVSLPNANGIQIVSSDNQIGGDSPSQRNVIAGTNQLATDNQGNDSVVQPGNNVFIAGDRNRVQGNYIGVDKFGTGQVGFSDIGVFIRTGDSNLIGGVGAQGNVISGNNFIGILIGYNRVNPLPITNTLIRGNLIGTDVNGKNSIPNGDGIALLADSSDTFIGGINPAERNVISGNIANGIKIASGWQGISLDQFGAANSPVNGPTFILGNIIGLDRTGRRALGNQLDGIFIGEATANTHIGDAIPSARNIISANHRNGIYLQGYAHDNFIEGNYIGTSINGIVRKGNHRFGVQIGSLMSPSNDNVVGGEAKTQGNVIKGNNKGNLFIDADSVNNVVIGNKIGKKKLNCNTRGS